MRRLFALLFAFALLASACGGDDSSGDAADGGTAGTDASQTDDAGTVDGDGADEAADDGAADDADDAAAGADDAAAGADGDDGNAEPRQGGEIVYGISADGTGFDLTKAMTPGSARIANALNDYLVGITPEGDWHPDVAESLTSNEDATEWTLTLREGIVFHDGASLDAEAVKANMDAYRTSPSVGFGYRDVASVDVVDPLTVLITMARPWAAFPYILSGQPGLMVSPSTIGNADDMVGVGPFKLENWNPGDSARVVRNPDYWRADEGLPHLDAITFKVIPEGNDRRTAMESDDLAAYAEPGSANIADLIASPDYDIHTSPGGGNEFLIILNTAKPPFDDAGVRVALAQAIDRQLLIENFRSGMTTPADSFFSPDSRYSVDNGYPDFDLQAAADAIAEYESTHDPVAVTLTHQDSGSADDIAEVVASFWEDAGVDVTLEPTRGDSAVDRALSDSFDAITWFQFGAPDPDIEYIFFHSSMGFLNWSNLVDPEIDEALDRGREATDEAGRASAYADLQVRLAEVMPIIWIDHLATVEAVAARAELKGFSDSTFVDGSPRTPMVNGYQHSYGQFWLDQ